MLLYCITGFTFYSCHCGKQIVKIIPQLIEIFKELILLLMGI
ncbi:25407_t:CDS:2 [Gigaspora margarita]|uniref:25407_t:CDS:1 n=1 Tax=Gigaspora margarita TaxID=4874 RepID=A0ABN7UV12_GIGMA|nr:25407_t:CDS:2 [Gigaspora margarita]